jgi:hypothetical protein
MVSRERNKKIGPWEGRGWPGDLAGQGARSERVGAGARTDRRHPDHLDFDLTSDLCANM